MPLTYHTLLTDLFEFRLRDSSLATATVATLSKSINPLRSTASAATAASAATTTLSAASAMSTSTHTSLEFLTKDFSSLKEEIPFLAKNLTSYITFDNLFYYTLACIAFNPIFWNIVARLQYRTKFITKVTRSAKLGCYLLAITIFSLGIYRDSVYHELLKAQPTYQPLLDSFIIKAVAVVSFAVGNIFVITSMWSLGVTGTYLGDYFGILMKERVTGFPFSVNNNPMYNGSTLCFLGTALWYGKPVGLVVTLFVWVMYKIALLFEEPFTAKIYAYHLKLDWSTKWTPPSAHKVAHKAAHISGHKHIKMRPPSANLALFYMSNMSNANCRQKEYLKSRFSIGV